MKKATTKPERVDNDDLRPEYDFSDAIRGKHYKPLHNGYTVHIHRADESTIVQHFKLEEGAVMLAPDVREVFPDSESVNRALRSLITLMRQMPDTRVTTQRGRTTGKKRQPAA